MNLVQHRVTPHSTTHFNPAELMFRRQIRSQLDITQYDLQTDMNERSPCEMLNFLIINYNFIQENLQNLELHL
jgi:hypothetical protein